MSWIRRLFGAMPREEMGGITLSHPRWALSGTTIDNRSRFLSALHRLAPEEAWLFLEGGSHPRELRSFLEARSVAVSPRPTLSTLWPRHQYFALPATQDVLAELVRLTRSFASSEICDHLHVFSGDNFFVSDVVSESRLENFCAEVGCGYRAVNEKDGYSLR